MNTNTQDFDIIKQALYSTKLSRMLAQENINVVFESSAKTASFSPESRTLTFPHSTAFLDQDIHELFMFHEVSHALHLPHDAIDQIREQKIDHSYFNIVIDIRDERLIKQKYPGCIKTFNAAYQKLLDQGFFGNKEVIAKRCFADRLNVYAKCGMKIASFIPLSAEEHAFYEKCMSAETFDEFMFLAQELQEMDKDSDNLNSMLNDLIESYELEFSDEEGEDPPTEEELRKRAEEEIQKMREERVQDIFDGTFEDSVLKNAHVINYKSIPLKDIKLTRAKSYVNSVKNVIKNIWMAENPDEVATVTQTVRDLRKSIQTSVDSMVRVFESRKAAEQYKNVRVSDTGMVDVNKVHRYQFDDKIFRRAARVPNAKNHAYYIMIDMSGSMSSIFSDVIEQVIVLTEFMRRIQVPYKVIGFGAVLDQPDCDVQPNYAKQNPLIFCESDLFEIMSYDQTAAEHNLAIFGLMKRFKFGLGGTPTGYAMLASEQYASEFFKSVRADKKHMVVITDGEPTDLQTGRWHNRGKTLLLVDPITKNVIKAGTSAPYATINAVGKIFEQRHNIKFTTISIMKTLTEDRTSSLVTAGVSEKMKTEWRASGYTKITDPYTQNEVYFAKPFGVETDIGSISADVTDKTASQIARAMLKNLKGVKKSRSFLNALAEKLS